MMKVLEVNNLYKGYKLGEINRKSLIEDFKYWVTRKEKVIDSNDRDSGSSKYVWALQDINFGLNQGEVLGIIGKNGAGKSTLLKLLSKVTAPTKGEIKIKGKLSSLLEVGTGFHPDLSGYDNIIMNGAILGMNRREIKSKLDDIIEFSGIGKYIHTPVKRYSSGMYVRLAFAVAAHLEPDILIVDEVLAVGDAEFQRKCLGKMGDVAKTGRTILFVSHNMMAVKNLCSRVVVLEHGRKILDGETNEMINGYLQRNQGSSLMQEWSLNEAPGNNLSKITKLEIVPDSGEKLFLKNSFNVKIDFEYFGSDKNLNLSLFVDNIEGSCVFNSVSPLKKCSKGKYQLSCQIPGNLLNNNTYSIRLMIVEEYTTALTKTENLITFEVEEEERLGNWFGQWEGIIRPQLEWSWIDNNIHLI